MTASENLSDHDRGSRSVAMREGMDALLVPCLQNEREILLGPGVCDWRARLYREPGGEGDHALE